MPTIKLLKSGKIYEFVSFQHHYISLDDRENFRWIPEIVAVRIDGTITVNGKKITDVYYGHEYLQLCNRDKHLIEYNCMVYDMDYTEQREMLYDAICTELEIEKLNG